MVLLNSDKMWVYQELALLCQIYSEDYPKLTTMREIAQRLCSVPDLDTCKSFYADMYSQLVLIQRFDAEFFFASQSVLVKIDSFAYCEITE